MVERMGVGRAGKVRILLRISRRLYSGAIRQRPVARSISGGTSVLFRVGVIGAQRACLVSDPWYI